MRLHGPTLRYTSRRRDRWAGLSDAELRTLWSWLEVCASEGIGDHDPALERDLHDELLARGHKNISRWALT